MKTVYIHFSKEGKIKKVFGTLKRAHSNLIDNAESIHRRFASFERFFNRFEGIYYITDHEGNGNGTVENFDIV